MAFLVALLTLVLLAVVVLVVGAPLRRAGRPDTSGRGASSTRALDDAPSRATSAGHGEDPGQMEDLEAAREAKYREIRDTELDYRTGKLSRQDYEAIDSDLRAEALALLNQLESSDRPSGATPSSGAEGDSLGMGRKNDADV
jgi:hypothetical protein